MVCPFSGGLVGSVLLSAVSAGESVWVGICGYDSSAFEYGAGAVHAQDTISDLDAIVSVAVFAHDINRRSVSDQDGRTADASDRVA